MAMINDKPTCDSCEQPMELQKRLPNAKARSKKNMRVRRFHCELCNYSKLIFAGGLNDESGKYTEEDWKHDEPIIEDETDKQMGFQLPTEERQDYYANN